jgi:hypothetical protein
VSGLLLLREDLQNAKRHLETLRSQPIDLDDQGNSAIDDAVANVAELQVKIQKREEVLGAGFAKATLKQASHDPFLAARLAAHALKERLLKRIRARKFELSRLEQHMGRPALGKLIFNIENLSSRLFREQTLCTCKELCESSGSRNQIVGQLLQPTDR